MICISLIFTLSNPLMIANQATGRVKKYQVICGSVQLLVLPISYVSLKLGFQAYSVFIVHFIVELITQCVRIILLRSLIGLNIKDYLWNVYSRVLLVVVISVIIPLTIYLNMGYTMIRFFTVCTASLISVSIVVYRIGLANNERDFVKSKFAIIKQRILENK